MASKAKWTFMVYMAGDNSLSTAGDKDLSEMRQAGSTPEVNIVVEFDNAGNNGTKRFLLQKGGQNDLVESLGETDTGSPDVLNDFISWTAKTYPADHYALVLWSHGSAWEPSEMDKVARSVGAQNYTPREAVERSASPLGKTFFRSSLKRIFSLPSIAERAICVDDGSGHSLDTIELGNVLEKAVQALGQPIDLLGMDACLMSNLEVAFQAKNFVRYIAASEESEPNDGWPYDVVLGNLISKPDQSAASLASNIVKAYVQSYLKQNFSDPVTQTAMDLSKIDAVAQSMDGLADALLACMPDAKNQIWMAQRNSARFWHNTLWDIADFSKELNTGATDPAIDQAVLDLQKKLKPGAGKFVVATSHHGTPLAKCGGVSVYLPALTRVSPFYGDLDFAKQHRWLSLLQANQS